MAHLIKNVFKMERIKGTSTFDRFIIILFVLHTLRFFNFKPYVLLGDTLTIYDTLFFIYFVLAAFVAKKCNAKKDGVWKAIVFLSVIFGCSLFWGYIVNGQSFYYGFKGMTKSYAYISFFFYLVYRNVSPSFLKKACWGVCILYAFAVLTSYVQYPNNVFGFQFWQDDFEALQYLQSSMDSRGVYRFAIPGADFITLALLYAVSSSKNRFKVVIIVVLLVLQLLRGARFPIVSTLFMAVVTYLIYHKRSFKNIVSICIAMFAAYLLAMNIPVIRNIIESYTTLTENQAYANETESDIRLQSLAYYFGAFNNGDLIANIFGNGVINSGRNEKVTLANQLGFFFSDIEYMMWFIYFGIIGLIGFFVWGCNCLKAKIDIDGTYLKTFVCYLFMVMCLGSHFFVDVPLICIVSYLLYKKDTTPIPSANVNTRQ